LDGLMSRNQTAVLVAIRGNLSYFGLKCGKIFEGSNNTWQDGPRGPTDI
jgi:hypothetical protein